DPAQLSLQRVKIRGATPNAPNSSFHQWSFGFQRELPGGLFIEADYVGTRSLHLNTLRDLNQPLNNGQTVLTNAQGQPILPYPSLGQIESGILSAARPITGSTLHWSIDSRAVFPSGRRTPGRSR